jgi:hypothetical protein
MAPGDTLMAMSAHPGSAPRWWAQSMLLAIVLTVAAPDHWSLPIPILGHSHDSQEHTDGDEAHERHCHGGAATCSDVPLAAATGIAFLAAWIGFGLAGGGAWRRACAVSASLAGRCVEVASPPPRSPGIARS